MNNEMKIRLIKAALSLYGAGCLAIYLLIAFIAWNPEPSWFTRFAWVVWTLAVIGTLIEEQKK